MKIIFLNRFFHPDHSATSQILSGLVFYLAQHKHNVHVISSRLLYDNTTSVLTAKDLIQGVAVYRTWSSGLGRDNLVWRLLDYISFILTCAWQLFLICEVGDIVITKTDPPMLSAVTGIIVKIRRGTHINWLQDLFPEVAIELGLPGFRGILGRLLLRIRNLSLSGAAVNVVVGEYMRDRLCRENIPASRISIIHNWAIDDCITPVPRQDNPLVQEWDLQDKFIVAYSGNLGRGHEFKTVLDAIGRLKDYTDIVFLFIGGGPGLEMVRQEIGRAHV